VTPRDYREVLGTAAVMGLFFVLVVMAQVLA
jgi:hypothetical protein